MPVLRDVEPADLDAFFEHQSDPEAVAMAAETSVLKIKGVKAEDFGYPLAVQKALRWEGRLFMVP